jgi:serine/threonine protein kinase
VVPGFTRASSCDTLQAERRLCCYLFMQTPTTTDARIGSLLGNFRIVRKLGEGGMGVVYEAENLKINSRVAVKLLHAHFAEDEEYAQRFLTKHGR